MRPTPIPDHTISVTLARENNPFLRVLNNMELSRMGRELCTTALVSCELITCSMAQMEHGNPGANSLGTSAYSVPLSPLITHLTSYNPTQFLSEAFGRLPALHLPTHPLLHPSHSSTRFSSHLSIYLPCIYPSTHPPPYQPTHKPTHLLIHLSL